MKHLLFFIGITLFIACEPQKPAYDFIQNVSLGEIAPIGVSEVSDGLWLADGDHNRLVKVERNGNVIESMEKLERPMHIDTKNDSVYIPEYGADRITILTNSGVDSLHLIDSLDAPAGISVLGDEIAIADFYNHRILYFNGLKWLNIGTEGKGEGEFYYPTDVQITSDKIYVADAYNHRAQVFDKKGKFLSTIGGEQGINAATGLLVKDEELFLTDFEHNRVLVFNISGELIQILEAGLSKPTDIIFSKNELIILNYKGKTMSFYHKE